VQDSSANNLSHLAANQLQGLCEFPDEFPDIRFEWVTEDDLQTKLRLEASAPGAWQISENFWIRGIQLKAEIDKFAPRHQSEGRMEGELKVGHNTIPVFYPFPGPFQLISSLRDIPLEHLILPLMPETELFTKIPAFRLREADFACVPSTQTFTLHGTTDDNWLLPIGREGLPLRQISLDLECEGHGAPITGKLHASIRLNGVETRVSCPVNDTSIFRGTNEVLPLGAVLDALCDRPSLRSLPAPFDPELQSASIQLHLGERTATVEGSTEAFGKTAIVIQEHEGVWGFTSEAELPNRWRLSYMDPFLAPLDALDQSRTSLIVTSFNPSPYPLGDNEDGTTLQARSGYNLMVPTHLAGIDSLNYLSRLTVDPFEVTFIGSFSRREYKPCFTLTSTLPTFSLARGVELLENRITLRHEEGQHMRLQLKGPAHFHIGETALEFTGTTIVMDDEAALEAKLNEPWKEPYGTRGIQVEKLTLDVYTDPKLMRSVRVVGTSSIPSAKGVARIYLDENGGDHVLWMSFEKLPAAALLNQLIPTAGASVRPAIRDAIAGGFEDVEISLAPHAREIRGYFKLAGERAHFEGQFGDEYGLDAFGSMRPLRWQPVAGGGHLVELSQGSTHAIAGFPEEFAPLYQGPLLRFYIGAVEHEPAIQLSAECTMFSEFSQSVIAHMTQKGLVFPLELREDEFGALRLECLVNESGFSGEGEIGLKVETDLHIWEPKSNAVMGIISVNGAVRANFKLKLGADGSYEAIFEGKLVWKNYELDFPAITLTKAPSDIRELTEQVCEALDERAYFIFKPLLGTEDDFFTAAGDWLQTGPALDFPAEDLAKAVRNTYSSNSNSLSVGFHSLGYPTKEVALALKTANRSPDGLAKALHAVECNPIEIAEALHSGMQAHPGVIAHSLRSLGYDPNTIANALKMGASTHPVSVAHALKSLGYDPYDIGNAIRGVFLIPVTVAYPIFKTAGFKARETVRALVLPYQTGAEETAQLMLGAGYSEREVRTALEKEMGETDVI